MFKNMENMSIVNETPIQLGNRDLKEIYKNAIDWTIIEGFLYASFYQRYYCYKMP